MYCVKCGRRALEGEKRCSRCGMRLVSPARLNRLLDGGPASRGGGADLAAVSKRLKRFGKRAGRRAKALAASLGRLCGNIGLELKVIWTMLRKRVKPRLALLGQGFAGLKQYLKELIKNLLGERDYGFYYEDEFPEMPLPRPVQHGPASPRPAKPKAGTGVKSASHAAKKPASKQVRPPERTSARPSVRKNADDAFVYGYEKNRVKHDSAAKARPEHKSRSDTPGPKPVSGSAARPGSGKPGNTKAGAASKPKRDIYAVKSVVKSSKATSGKPGKKQVKKKSPGARLKRFAEKNLRTVVAMALLAAAFLVFIAWGSFSDGGRAAFARMGMGSARGYMLIGDECMESGNYSRAVENYYSSINKKITCEAAYKLAAAYSYTGDVSREVSALLLCIERFPDYKPAYTQLHMLYPDTNACPAKVSAALMNGLTRFGTLE